MSVLPLLTTLAQLNLCSILRRQNHRFESIDCRRCRQFGRLECEWNQSESELYARCAHARTSRTSQHRRRVCTLTRCETVRIHPNRDGSERRDASRHVRRIEPRAVGISSATESTTMNVLTSNRDSLVQGHSLEFDFATSSRFHSFRVRRCGRRLLRKATIKWATRKGRLFPCKQGESTSAVYRFFNDHTKSLLKKTPDPPANGGSSVPRRAS